MSPQISTFQGVLILGVVALLAGAAMMLPRFARDPYAELQTRNLALADKYVRTISPVLQQDPRFRDVRVCTFTGRDGVVVIGGWVASDADVSDLKRIIDQSQPRVGTSFEISVGAEERIKTFDMPTVGATQRACCVHNKPIARKQVSIVFLSCRHNEDYWQRYADARARQFPNSCDEIYVDYEEMANGPKFQKDGWKGVPTKAWIDVCTRCNEQKVKWIADDRQRKPKETKIL